MDSSTGHIYCMSIPPNLMTNKTKYKIGFTRRPVSERLHEANHNAFVLEEYQCDLEINVSDPQLKEWAVHHMLKQHRVNKHKEFFDAPLSKIRNVFQLVSQEPEDFVKMPIMKISRGKAHFGSVKSYHDFEEDWRIVYQDGKTDDCDWKGLISGIKQYMDFCNSEIGKAFGIESADERSFIGRRVAKNFTTGICNGYIKSYKYPYWRVVYEDGDREEYDWKELIAGLKKGEVVKSNKALSNKN
jgi:hypothetical protein